MAPTSSREQRDLNDVSIPLWLSRSSRFDAAALQKRLAARGVIVSAPQKDTFLIGVNETINRTTAAALTEAFTG